MPRSSSRGLDDLRSLSIETDVNLHAEGSALIKWGNTHVLCTVSIEHGVPRWMRNSEKGWLTAEYGMLPRSTHERMGREAARGKQSGRTQEIQRLIGRSLRQAVNLKYLCEKTIQIDCDVIQADGGTRTASITGACVALFSAIKNHHDDQRAMHQLVSAVSLGIKDDEILVDLDYQEDSAADTDLNIVMTEDQNIIEIQGTAEHAPFSVDQLHTIVNKAKVATDKIINIQKEALKL